MVAYFDPNKYSKKQFLKKGVNKQLLSVNATISKKKSMKKLKKTPSKVAQKYSIFFCLTALAQTENDPKCGLCFKTGILGQGGRCISTYICNTPLI